MKYVWTTIMVNNLEASIKFYREVLGLLENRRFPAGPSMEIAFMGEGETEVELICDEKKQSVNIGQDISLGFEAGPLEPMMELLKEKGIPILSGPHQPNPRIRYIYVLDPNGVKIQLVENQ
jgi:lactoylglutathione lyase